MSASGQHRQWTGNPQILDDRSADEYRAIIGHEIGHILAGHLAKTERQDAAGGMLGALLGIGLIAAAGASDVPIGTSVSAVHTATQIGGVLGRMRFSQTFELEADYIGAEA